jgi:hypothetical protein
MTDTTTGSVGPVEHAQHAGEDGPAPSRRRRMSAKRKQSAVLRLLRGEDLELVSRELAVPAAEVSAWRDAFQIIYNQTWIVERQRLPDPSGRQRGASCAAPGSRMKLQCGVSQLWAIQLGSRLGR